MAQHYSSVDESEIILPYYLDMDTSQTTLDRLEQFTDCADWAKGVARIRCEGCGHSYFKPFSCKVFHLCPSCDQKRTLSYAEYLAEDLLLELSHRQFVFTIPKILRPYFKSDKRLFGEVSKLIFSLLSDFFSLAAGQKLLCACVVSYQFFGESARFHQHWHVLILEGGFTKYDRFVYLPVGADKCMLKVWQATILSLFLHKELIDQTSQAKLGTIVTESLRGPFGAAFPAPLESQPAPSMASALGRKSLHVFANSNLPHPFVCPKCQATMSVVGVAEKF